MPRIPPTRQSFDIFMLEGKKHQKNTYIYNKTETIDISGTNNVVGDI